MLLEAYDPLYKSTSHMQQRNFKFILGLGAADMELEKLAYPQIVEDIPTHSFCFDKKWGTEKYGGIVGGKVMPSENELVSIEARRAMERVVESSQQVVDKYERCLNMAKALKRARDGNEDLYAHFWNKMLKTECEECDDAEWAQEWAHAMGVK